jgi:hypothetical protein
MQLTNELSQACPFHLRFASLAHEADTLSFECDERGLVDLDTLDAPARGLYFRARTLIGREFARPVIVDSRLD